MAIFTVPILIGVAAAAAGATGGKKGYDGYKKNDEAGRIRSEADDLIASETEKLEKARSATQKVLSNLGEAKIRISGTELKTFKDAFSRITNPSDLNLSKFDKNNLFDFGDNYLPPNLEKTVSSSYSILGSGIRSIGTSALVGAGAYSAVGSLATASTGTAISTLSGAAAKSATLAWLGGGAVSAGGAGVAGGAAVLGGVVAGPALLVGGWVYASRAEENLSSAKEYKAEVLENAQQMRNGVDTLEDIQDFAERFRKLVERLRSTLSSLNDEFVELVNARAVSPDGQVDARSFDEKEVREIYRTYQCALAVYELLQMDVMDE